MEVDARAERQIETVDRRRAIADEQSDDR